MTSSESSKILADLRLAKLNNPPRRKKRVKRELVNVPPSSHMSEVHIRGSELWAPLEKGAVRLVKRFTGPANLNSQSSV